MGFVVTRGDRSGQCQRAPRGVGQISGQQILKKVLEDLCREVPSYVPTTTALAAWAVCGNAYADIGVGQAGYSQAHKLSQCSIYVCTAKDGIWGEMNCLLDPGGHFLCPCVMVQGRSGEQAPEYPPAKRKKLWLGMCDTAPHPLGLAAPDAEIG